MIKISDAEYEVMAVIWKYKQPLNALEILEDITRTNDWKKSTVNTLITRLVEKGALQPVKEGRYYYYQPLIEEGDYKKQEAKGLLSKLYNNSIKNLIATLYEGDDLTQEDIDELKNYFKEKE